MSVIFDPFDFLGLSYVMLSLCYVYAYVMLLGYVILSEVGPYSFPPVSCSFPEPHLGPESCLYNLLEGQPEISSPLGGKYCTIYNPSRYSSLHLPCFLQHVQQ